jgi:hypothetical protein
MKPILSFLVLAMVLSILSGCLVRTRTYGRGNGRRACPPSTHWDGYNCVHNGNGRGPKVRDHRR